MTTDDQIVKSSTIVERHICQRTCLLVGLCRLAPPFHIHCLYTDVKPERRLREVVTGDLSGVLETLFRKDPEEGGTRVTFNWYIRVTNPVLNALGYLAERIYRHSHDSVMTAGESGLNDYCARQLRS